MDVWQLPARHVCPDGQSDSFCALPRASQVRTRVAFTHSLTLGVHAGRRQVPSGPQ